MAEPILIPEATNSLPSGLRRRKNNTISNQSKQKTVADNEGDNIMQQNHQQRSRHKMMSQPLLMVLFSFLWWS